MTTAIASKPQAATADTCDEHIYRPAKWRCVRCERILCDECIREREIRNELFQMCRSCGDRCERIEDYEQRILPRASFFDMLPSAFLYPVRGSGIALLILGVLFFGTMKFLSGSMWGTVCLFVGAGYYTAWLFKIVNETAMGNSEPAGFPEFTDFIGDILAPLFRVFLTSLVSFGPMYACVALGVSVHPLFFAGALAFLVAGMVYFPIAFLATALHTTIAFSPVEVFATIGRVFVPYLVASVVVIATTAIVALFGLILAFVVPIFGGILADCLSLYASVFQMHILGLLFYANEEEFGWFSSANR